MHFRTRQMKRLWVPTDFTRGFSQGRSGFRTLWQGNALAGNHQVGSAYIRILKERYFFQVEHGFQMADILFVQPLNA
jgi:hypothetical protein